jgi:hypothetical protein
MVGQTVPVERGDNLSGVMQGHLRYCSARSKFSTSLNDTVKEAYNNSCVVPHLPRSPIVANNWKLSDTLKQTISSTSNQLSSFGIRHL